MRTFLRGFIYVLISWQVSVYVCDALRFVDSKVFFLVILAFTLLNLFIKPLLKLVAFHSQGPLFLAMSAFLHVILINILVLIIPDFWIKGVTTRDLIISSIVIPSKNLNVFEAGVLAATIISLSYNLLDWLSAKSVDKKEKAGSK